MEPREKNEQIQLNLIVLIKCYGSGPVALDNLKSRSCIQDSSIHLSCYSKYGN